MDNATFRDGEFNSYTTMNSPGSSSNPGAFFPRSSGFIVAGGTFTTHIVHQAAPSIPADFRMFPWSDIDLRHEIRLGSGSSAANRERGRGAVRRLYYGAKIERREADLTVAVYEGDNSEEEWKQEVAKYSQLRHPNILQIFGAASSSGMHAIIANDDLVPLRDFLKLYQHLPISTVYIYGICEADFGNAYAYMRSKFKDPLASARCRFWIRPSTNMLCVELPIGEVEDSMYLTRSGSWSHNTKIYRNDLNQEARLIDSLELDHYHTLCYWQLGKIREFRIWGTEGEFDMGAVICYPAGSQLESSAKIAVLAITEIHPMEWFPPTSTGETMEDGWTRYKCDEVFGQQIWCGLAELPVWQKKSWLPQANSVFTQLRITYNHEDYVVITGVYCRLEVSRPVQDPPEGYLFVFPEDDFRTGPTTFRLPSCPAYWSVDPSGVERLSADEAEHLGFPAIKIAADVTGYSWDSSVYSGLRKFHQGKGFDPDSLDVARHVGYPLYQLFSGIEMPFAHVHDEVSGEEEEGGDYSASIPNETLTPGNEVQGRHPSNEVNMKGADVCALANLKSTGLLDASMSKFRGPSIPGPLIVAEKSPHLSFPHEIIDTPWDSHPRVNAHGIFTVTSPSLPPVQDSDGSGLTGPSSTSTFFTYPPPELPSISSYPLPELPSIFSSMRAATSTLSLPAHPNSPPWTQISAAENQSVDPEDRGNPSPTISHHKRAAEEIDSERPQKKSTILSDFLLDDLR